MRRRGHSGFGQRGAAGLWLAASVVKPDSVTNLIRGGAGRNVRSRGGLSWGSLAAGSRSVSSLGKGGATNAAGRLNSARGRGVALWQSSEAEPATWVSLGVGLGVAAVGAVAGVAARRAGRRSPRRADLPVIGEPLRGTPRRVPLGQGCYLWVDVDEPEGLPADAPTVVLCHGYALSHESWYFQRLALRGAHRVVVWDQRGHGASPRCEHERASIDLLGDDLARVIAAAAPSGPLVLVGHSMGGMTVMSFAAHHREEFERRVVGVGLVATSAYNVRKHGFGWGPLGWWLHDAAPPVLGMMATASTMMDRSRRVSAAVEQRFVHRYSFASPVSPSVSALAGRLISGTSISVLSDFVGEFAVHDKRDALDAMRGVETLVLTGDRDVMIPASYSDRIVRQLPHAEYVTVPDTGHLVMLERPEVVTAHLDDLLVRSARSADLGA